MRRVVQFPLAVGWAEQRAGVQEVRAVEEETAGELAVVRVSSVARFCWRSPVSFGLGQSAGVEQ